MTDEFDGVQMLCMSYVRVRDWKGVQKVPFTLSLHLFSLSEAPASRLADTLLPLLMTRAERFQASRPV